MSAEHNHHRPGAHSAPVLDIGGEVGALVVYLAARPPTGELEACPAGDTAARFQTGVHHRSTPSGWTWRPWWPGRRTPVRAVSHQPEAQAPAMSALDRLKARLQFLDGPRVYGQS